MALPATAVNATSPCAGLDRRRVLPRAAVVDLEPRRALGVPRDRIITEEFEFR